MVMRSLRISMMDNCKSLIFRAEGSGQTSYKWGMLAGAAAAVMLVLIVRKLIGHVPLYDELLHVLAAKGMRDTGIPVIAGGMYTRALLFTELVVAAERVFGDSLIVARLPALLAALFTAFLISVWTTRKAGIVAASVAALLFCLLPVTIELAVFVRFYTLHTLLVLAIGILFYEATGLDQSLKRRVLLVIFGLLLVLPSFHLQSTTAVAMLSILVATAALLVFDCRAESRVIFLRHPILIALGAVLLTGCCLMLGIRSGLLAQMSEVPLWAASSANRPHFYLEEFATTMPLFWPLFPVALFLSYRFQPRLTVFCGALFFCSLAVHSVAAAKSSRYLFYTFPFFCTVWGCAVAEIAVLASQAQVQRSGVRLKSTAWILTVVVLVLSAEGQGAAKLAFGKLGSSVYAGEPEWGAAVETLRPLVVQADRVITSNAMEALYYLGRYDYELNASIVVETDSGNEFGLDERTGGHAISTADSVRKVIGMAGATLVVLEDKKTGVPVGVPAEAMDVIVEACTSVALPANGSAIHAWQCNFS